MQEYSAGSKFKEPLSSHDLERSESINHQYRDRPPVNRAEGETDRGRGDNASLLPSPPHRHLLQHGECRNPHQRAAVRQAIPIHNLPLTHATHYRGRHNSANTTERRRPPPAVPRDVPRRTGGPPTHQTRRIDLARWKIN